jgi:excisionase family DNA binding protein
MLINAQLDLTPLLDLEKRMNALEKKLLVEQKRSSPYVTIEEAMQYLNCSYSKVRRLIDRGFLKKSLDSRHIKILRSSMEAYIMATASS